MKLVFFWKRRSFRIRTQPFLPTRLSALQCKQDMALNISSTINVIKVQKILHIKYSRTLKFLCLRLLGILPHLSVVILFTFVSQLHSPQQTNKQTNKHKTELSILQKDQRELIIVIRSNQDNRSCWSGPKPTEGSYFISRDNLFFSVCHMVLQLQRSNRFVDVNFSSVLKKF